MASPSSIPPESPGPVFVTAEAADPDARAVFATAEDGGRHLLLATDARLAGLEIQPYRPDPVAVVHAAFADRVAAGLPVVGQGGAVALDPDSRRELTSAVVMAGADAWPAGGYWRLTDNSNLPLDRDQVVALGKAAAAHYQALFATRSALLDAIAAGEAVDPAAGWPDAPAFDPAG